MRHEMPDQHRTLLWFSVVEASSGPHRCVCKRRYVVRNPVVQLKAAALIEHHGRYGGDGFSHRVDANDGVALEGTFQRFVGEPLVMLVANSAVSSDHDAAARETLGIHLISSPLGKSFQSS